MIISISDIRGILRRNIPIMLMSIELMLLALNLNFLAFSVSSDDMMGQSFASLIPTVATAKSAVSSDDMMGQSFASLIPTVATAKSAIGLVVFVITLRVRGTIAVESINL